MMKRMLRVISIFSSYFVSQLKCLGTYSEMDTSLGVYPLIGSPNSHREQRTCVIKKIQERTPLSKALDHLLMQLERKDPQNFFAWPVTDNIAPGYSKIISKPMDFSTMRQKVEDNQYKTLKV